MNRFNGFPKIARLSRSCTITEKLDGTNAQITITDDGQFLVGSRSRWITPEDDNHGFAAWALENKEELLKLGVGTHFGEWWGFSIQRGYNMKDKIFSLFNTKRWSDDTLRPECCSIVPVLYEGMFTTDVCEKVLQDLQLGGSVASKGFMRPEGVVVYHHAANICFKKTVLNDSESKGGYQRPIINIIG